MTREEAIFHLSQFKKLLHANDTEEYRINTDSIDFAIKALEQEPILDKIRAEIEPKCDRIYNLISVFPYAERRDIQELLCEIMDLCDAESEDKE